MNIQNISHTVNNFSQVTNSTPARNASKEYAAEKTAENSRISPDFDRVDFSSHAAVQDDASFAAVLSEKISAQVASGTSPERVERIRDEVVSGSYRVSAERVAAKILGYGD